MDQPSNSLQSPAGATTQRLGRWTDEEKALFRELMVEYAAPFTGREETDWQSIARHFPHRTIRQVRSHGQKVLQKITVTQYEPAGLAAAEGTRLSPPPPTSPRARSTAPAAADPLDLLASAAVDAVLSAAAASSPGSAQRSMRSPSPRPVLDPPPAAARPQRVSPPPTPQTRRRRSVRPPQDYHPHAAYPFPFEQALPPQPVVYGSAPFGVPPSFTMYPPLLVAPSAPAPVAVPAEVARIPQAYRPESDRQAMEFSPARSRKRIRPPGRVRFLDAASGPGAVASDRPPRARLSSPGFLEPPLALPVRHPVGSRDAAAYPLWRPTPRRIQCATGHYLPAGATEYDLDLYGFCRDCARYQA